MKLRKGLVIAALYPVGMLLVQLLLAFYVVALLIGKGVRLLETAIYGPVTVWPRWLAQTIIASLIGGSIAFWTVLGWFKAKDSKFFAKTRRANLPELQVHITTFQSEIAVAMDSDVDEVLVV